MTIRLSPHQTAAERAAAAAPSFGAAIVAAPFRLQDGEGSEPVQRVVKVRRDYNTLVARESMEDYALRFTPRSFRKWSEWRVANTAFGAASFLVLEAVGATLLVSFGFTNALWAILATGVVIFVAGLPVSLYAARYGVDMDLLTRGAGFGYIGSTVTSLIYASFTFIFFALEAAIMAYALDLAFDIPPAWGYLLCALAVLPLVTHGVTTISRLQVWTQPLWIVLLVVPYVYVFQKNPGLVGELARYAGADGAAAGFDLLRFGAATTVVLALITQMGEQADYLRFMPERRAGNRWRWWAGVLVGGPGWVLPGIAKMLGGALLAYLAISHAVPLERAVDPNQMYLAAYEYVFPRQSWAIAATALLVVVSQLKINVTNAYAGSLAWSNFFARLTHSHPGRVVWVVFNTAIALLLMELNVFQALGKVLGLYSNIAIAWMMAVVADLVVNKPLGLSPPGIEFKRAHLYDINPVGIGAMGLASLLSIAAYLGLLGGTAQAFSALIALVTAFVTAPLIAWWTGGRYYLARRPDAVPAGAPSAAVAGAAAPASPAAATACTICERAYEADDMAHCPAYLGHICSLCCSLDARCADMCKPHANWAAQWRAALQALLPRRWWRGLDTELGRYLLLMALILPALGLLFSAIYQQQAALLPPVRAAAEAWQGTLIAQLRQALTMGFVKAFAVLAIVTAIVAWWLVLTHQSRQVAQEESNRQTQALNEQAKALRREIESHRRTDLALQQANQTAERARAAADQANQAKTRYISAISHELRTPLNSIIGYAQLLEEDDTIPPHRRRAVSVIRRGGDHLLSLIEGTLDIARIEAGKLSLDVRPLRFRDCLQQVARLFELQAAAKGIEFWHAFGDDLPEAVRGDEKRLRQILINIVGNAVKFTAQGRVVLRVQHARDMATFEVEDSGPGIAEAELASVFEPFTRGAAPASGAVGEAAGRGVGGGGGDSAGGADSIGGAVAGTGLGLTIARMLTDLMGGQMTVTSTLGHGTTFRIRLFLPALSGGAAAALAAPRSVRVGYSGARRRLLVVDNEEVDRELLVGMLAPLGFEVRQAASGADCLAALRESSPDALLMDLAMPGLDGWQTMRAIRAGQLSDAPIAVVSANAFEKGADNDLGLGAADFIVKPVRKDELLDWLGRALALHWLEAPLAPVPEAAVAVPVAGRFDAGPPPSAASLDALQQLIDLGYQRGVLARLDEIAVREPEADRFVAHLRELAGQFQLEAMSGVIRKARDAAV